MTYAEHEGWMMKEKKHKEEIKRMAEMMAEQEEIMEKLIEERDDIVVIERHTMCVDKDYIDPKEHYGSGYMYRPPAGRYLNFPRFIGTDSVAMWLDRGFVEMHQEIRQLENKLKKTETNAKLELIHVRNNNYIVPFWVYNQLSKRFKRILGDLMFEYRKK